MKIWVSSLILVINTLLASTGAYSLTHVSSFNILEDGKIQIDAQYSKAEKGFTYGRNNLYDKDTGTISISKLESILEKNQDYSLLTEEEIQSRGKLFSKAGAYYAHINHNYVAAINKMCVADKVLSNANDKTWNYIQLAYSYERKFAHEKLNTDKLQAANYIYKARANLREADRNEKAMLYCIEGRISENDNNRLKAEWNYHQALYIYRNTQAEQVNKFIFIKKALDTQHGMTFLDGTDWAPFLQKQSSAGAYCHYQLS